MTKYTIISVSSLRAKSKQEIRHGTTLEEVTSIRFFSPVDNMLHELSRLRVRLRPDIWLPRTGELGVWLSQLNCWEYASKFGDLLVLEDDAILLPGFQEWFDSLALHEYEVVAIFGPDNQAGNYSQDLDRIGDITVAWQGYSCVAMWYSQLGAARLLNRARVTGITTPVDCWIFEQDNIHGIKPGKSKVSVDWNALTHIHNTKTIVLPDA